MRGSSSEGPDNSSICPSRTVGLSYNNHKPGLSAVAKHTAAGRTAPYEEDIPVHIRATIKRFSFILTTFLNFQVCLLPYFKLFDFNRIKLERDRSAVDAHFYLALRSHISIRHSVPGLMHPVTASVPFEILSTYPFHPGHSQLRTVLVFPPRSSMTSPCGKSSNRAFDAFA